MFFFNIVLTIVTFVAYTLPFLAPKAFPFLSVLTLILPFFLMLNLFFFVYWLLQFKRYMLLSGIVLLVGITFINRFYKFTETNLPKEETDFTLMSYNVRLFNLYQWLPKDDVAEQISKLISDKNPDILCIQEYSDLEKTKLINQVKLYNMDFKDMIKNKLEEKLDIIYLDPPFFTLRTQKGVLRNEKKVVEFQDSWKDLEEYIYYI